MRKTSVPKNIYLCAAVAALVLNSVGVFAQSDVGTITGFVLDPSSAGVPNATVAIKNEAINEERRVTTDAQGHYTVPNLLPGLYTLTASAPGFKTFESTHNQLDPNSTIALNANLAVGQLTETIQVSATAEVLQTESGSVQAEVTGQEIDKLELNGRSPIYAAQFLSGVRSNGTLGDFNGVGLSGNPFNINGARVWDTLVTVDGAPAMRTRANGAVIGVGDVDATQEVQVLTADYAPEYGRASGGQIRMVTKGGTSEFHGSMYEYFRNSDLNSNTWQRNLSTSTDFQSPFRYNNFGFAVGGPVWIPKVFDKWRNKFFWFVAEDWIRERNTQTQTEPVPTTLMREGNYSELLAPNPWYKGVTQLYYPGTCPKLGNAGCIPIPGNIIPPSMLSPNGIAILNAYPAPDAGLLAGDRQLAGPSGATDQSAQRCS